MSGLSDLQFGVLFFIAFLAFLKGYLSLPAMGKTLHDTWLGLVFTIARKRLDRDYDKRTKK